MAGASGKKLHDTYTLAWLRGLKTTYYLRTIGATSAEKSTAKIGQLNAVTSDGAAGGFGASAASSSGASNETNGSSDSEAPKFCAIDDPDCEACQ